MVKVRPEDLNCAETGVTGWTLSVLATVVAKIETADLLMIASLNIVVKTFYENCKNICWIVGDDYCNKKKTCHILHFKEKYAKIDCKNEIYAKNWVGKTGTAKVNLEKSKRSKSTVWSMMTSTDMMDDVSRWWTMTSALANMAMMTSAGIEFGAWGTWLRLVKMLNPTLVYFTFVPKQVSGVTELSDCVIRVKERIFKCL